jgi:hypothetical protein
MKKHAIIILAFSLLLSVDAFAQHRVGSLWIGAGTAPASFKIFTKQSVTSAGWIIEAPSTSDQLAIYLDGSNINFVSSGDKIFTVNTTQLAVGATQLAIQGAVGGYGAGVEFGSQLTGGAYLPMAKVSADGDAAWDTTAANQDARLGFWTAINGTLTERLRISSSGNVDAITSLSIGSGTAIAKHLSATATLDFPNSTGPGCNALTMTVTGAADGDVVSLGVPLGAWGASSVFAAYVNAADTVTVKHCITDTATINPNSVSIRADVWKH